MTHCDKYTTGMTQHVMQYITLVACSRKMQIQQTKHACAMQVCRSSRLKWRNVKRAWQQCGKHRNTLHSDLSKKLGAQRSSCKFSVRSMQIVTGNISKYNMPNTLANTTTKYIRKYNMPNTSVCVADISKERSCFINSSGALPYKMFACNKHCLKTHAMLVCLQIKLCSSAWLRLQNQHKQNQQIFSSVQINSKTWATE